MVDQKLYFAERKIQLLINHLNTCVKTFLAYSLDTLEGEDQLADVKEFVSNNFKDLLNIEPLVFPVSSKLALNAKLAAGGDTEKLTIDPQWKKSRFGDLEGCI